MCELLVTSDPTFFETITENQQKEFFQKSYDWIKERYGEENIISANVHLDEKTPHMHVDFVPITKDNRLCAKDLFNRKTLFELHNDFYKDIGSKFNLERGETKEDKRRHLSVEDFKITTKKEEIKEIIYNLSESTKDLEKKKFNLEIEKDRLDNKIDVLKSSFKGLHDKDISLMDISSIKASKSILGGKITLSENDYNKLIDNAKLGIILNGVQKNYENLKKEYNKLKNDFNFSVEDQIKNATLKSEVYNLQRDKQNLSKKIKNLEKFISKNKLTEKYLIDSEKNKNNKKVQKYER